MTDLSRAQTDALAPVRKALLAAAHADADRLLADAEREAGRLEAEAARRAEEVRAEARRRGAADGAERLAQTRAVARREARAIVLRAQREAYDRLREAAVVAVAEDLSRGEVRDRLRALVTDVLGVDAALAVGPHGGLRARAADGRVVDASAERLVDLALADLDVEGLWEP